MHCPRCFGHVDSSKLSAGTVIYCPGCNASLKNPEYTDLEGKMRAIQDEAFRLWQDRQKKYGPTNISRTGALGCYVRANDKLARLHEYYMKGSGGDASDESVADSWLDLLNYATMGLACHRHEWPET